MNQDSACAPSDLTLRTMSVPFSEIPGQTRLFVDYQQDPLSLSKFYPAAVESHTQIADRIPEVLANYSTDRKLLCDALDEINGGLDAGEKTFEHIRILRRPDCVAVVTGQQAGLFTGPLYTIYKALSAVRTAECLRKRGFPAVPVFWTASEDHDFEEVSSAVVLDAGGELVRTRFNPQTIREGTPVGYIELDDSIRETIDGLMSTLPKTEFTAEVDELLKDSWASGTAYGQAFSRMLTRILGKYGIIIFDPLHGTLKRLAAPMYVKAIEEASGIVGALMERDNELKAAGYHSQVLVTDDYFPLFLHREDGTRHALKRTKSGAFKSKGDEREFTAGELSVLAGGEPERFSPTVVLRPVVQDYLLPTVCYFGGGAEIAYFAQNSEVYRVMGRPVTPILHRQSFTVVEAKHARTLEKYGLDLKALFDGKTDVLARVVETFVNPELAGTITDAEEKINAELDRLDQGLTALDPTLAKNLATRRRKILYHIGALRKKSHFAATKKDETLRRQIDGLFTSLLPNMHLQERTLNIVTFVNAHGRYFVDWVYDSVDLDDKGHRIIFL